MEYLFIGSMVLLGIVIIQAYIDYSMRYIYDSR